MTTEEAIRILDPETRRETMRQIPVFERIDADQKACKIAVAALRAQQPRTLDRSRWKGCWVCNEHRCASCEFFGLDGRMKPCCRCSPLKEKREYKPASYCSCCGTPLTEAAWAVLERKIGGSESQ